MTSAAPMIPSRFVFVRQPTTAIAPGGPVPNLQQYGKALIAKLTYRIIFVGEVWKTAYLASQAKRLDAALQAALSSATCNAVFTQYFAAKTTISATPHGKHGTLEVPWPEVVDRNDLQKMATKLLANGLLPKSGLKDFALALVLPPGTILSLDDSAATVSAAAKPTGRNSMEGLGAYHGQFQLTGEDGKPHDVYFCVTVWSDGSNGAAVPAGGAPAWEPWENACAALYHELGEIRLCPNVDKAPVTDQPPPIADLGWLVWYQDAWQEIGDLPVLWAGARPQKVFCKGTIGGLADVPIQALWSNAPLATSGKPGPYAPPGFKAQLP